MEPLLSHSLPFLALGRESTATRALHPRGEHRNNSTEGGCHRSITQQGSFTSQSPIPAAGEPQRLLIPRAAPTRPWSRDVRARLRTRRWELTQGF